MANPNDQIYVEHILGAMALIEQFVAGKKFADFERDQMLQSAVTRQLEIIGEAAKRLSPELKERLAQVPWQQITTMRNFLIHDYLDIDLKIVWKAAAEDISVLKQALVNWSK